MHRFSLYLILFMEPKKILFIGLSSSIINEIEHLFDKEKYTPVFADPEKAGDYIADGSFSLIATGDLSHNNNPDIIHSIKASASDKSIPLITIISGGKMKPYITAHNEDISAIITTPILKNDFFHFLDRYIDSQDIHESDFTSDPENTEKNPLKISDFTGSLILNILAQNRIVKKLIKKKTALPGMHFMDDSKNILKREIEELLWEALDKNWFRLHYQPVISLESGKPSGFESLIRIEHPVKGLIPPGDFIAVAENSAIIFPLGLWIIEEACRQIEYWKTKFSLDIPLKININLSARQFIHPQLTSHIFEIIDKYNIDSNDIGFELTESAFMEDMESANISLLELRSRKFTLYMDDFGTGYSSLSYLMHFPVDIIKIDQSFVKWMHIDEQSETLVKSLVALAHNLGLKVVAEGVDDESHIDILKECGCDYGQGYFFSKPLSSDKADDFLSQYFKNSSK